MNVRLLIILLAIFIGITLVLFIFIKGLPFGLPQQSPSSTSQIPLTTQKTITLPVDQTHKGVSSATLFYQFSGKVTNIEPVGKNTRITLDISDSQLPEFLATSSTFVFMAPGSGSEPKTIKDVKVGSDVIMTMSYSLNNRTWKLDGISIQENLFPSPPATLPLPQRA